MSNNDQMLDTVEAQASTAEQPEAVGLDMLDWNDPNDNQAPQVAAPHTEIDIIAEHQQSVQAPEGTKTTSPHEEFVNHINTPTAERRKELEAAYTDDSKVVTAQYAVYEEHKYKDHIPVSVFGIPTEVAGRSIETWPNIESDDETTANHARHLFAATNRSLPTGIYENLFGPETDWNQSIQHEGVNLEVATPRLKDFGGYGKLLTGDRAISRINTLMGTGALLQTPLWHSGFWLWLKPPTNSQLLDLEEMISAEKIRLGRDKNGLTFSNSAVYIVQILSNFIIGQIYDSTLADSDVNTILSKIKITDWFRLVHTLAVTIYPNGYSMSIPCTADIESCQHVEKVHANLAKMFWNDRCALTDEQRKHMSNRKGTMKTEDVLKYATSGRFATDSLVSITDDIKIRLHVPSIADYLQSGVTWVDGIVEAVEQMFDDRTIDATARERIIERHAQSTVLREYEHWVKQVELGNGEEIISDAADISRTLEALSAIPENGRAFREGISKYIDQVTISVIAVPRFKCPKCGKHNNEGQTFERHPFLVPLDPVKLFFTLRDRRLSHINMR